MGKFNPKQIVTDHVGTLRSYRTGRPDWVDLIFFFGAPLVIAGLVLWQGIELGAGMVNILITSMSIFIALLFNLLMLVYDIISRRGDGERSELHREFLRQIFSNISFAILDAIAVVIFLLLWVIVVTPHGPDPSGPVPSAVGGALSAVVFYLVAMFLITLFLVLQRVHVLLAKKFGGR